MIITKLIGGLGNQMFQYAAGRRLAFVNKTILKMDLSGYKHQEKFATKRQYMISIFNIVENFATSEEIASLTEDKSSLIKKYLPVPISRMLPVNQSYILEKSLDFDPNILGLKDNVYLEGFWQSEKYFKDIEDLIRREFTFKSRPNRQNRTMLHRIKSSNSVSLHVRRGDYVKDKATTKFHGICDIDYYRKGLKIIARSVRNPTLFVFSDEPDWVKENMKFGYEAVYVTQNAGKSDHEDMRLMAACQHNIIVNSSFSWWGAWLNTNPEKVVVAPKRWFAAQKVKLGDRIPQTWIKI